VKIRGLLTTMTVACAALALGMAAASGQTPASAPTTTSAPTTRSTMCATVKEATGVAKRLVKENEWAPLQVGDELDEMTVILTGFGSKVVLAFADNSTVTIDRATKIGIGEFRKVGNVTTTKLGLKYGSIRADVEKAKGPNDFTVQTPVATLAVRGTAGDIGYTGDFGLNMRSEHGVWNMVRGFQERNIEGTEGVGDTLTMWVNDVLRTVTVVLGDTSAMTPGEVNFVIANAGSGRVIAGSTPSGGGPGGGSGLGLPLIQLSPSPGGSPPSPPPSPPPYTPPTIPTPPLNIDVGG
jgi:hypothetical protein